MREQSFSQPVPAGVLPASESSAFNSLDDPRIYHQTVVSQNAEIIRQNAEIIRLNTELIQTSTNGHRVTRDGVERVRTSVDNLSFLIIANTFKALIAVVISGSASWMFFTSMIKETTWLVLIALSVSPWYHEWIPTVFRAIFPRPEPRGTDHLRLIPWVAFLASGIVSTWVSFVLR